MPTISHYSERSMLFRPGVFLAKMITGFLVGAILAVATFFIIASISQSLDQIAVQETDIGVEATMNPIIPLVFLIIACLITFVGNIMITGILNIIYSNIYYDIGQLMIKPLVLNIMLFIAFAALYFISAGSFDTLYLIIVIHILLSAFLSCIIMDTIATPSYSAMHIIGYAVGLVITLIIALIMYQQDLYQESILLIPAIGYVVLFLFHSFWARIYVKLTDGGSDFLMTPTLEEVTEVVDEDDTDVNITI